MKAVVKKLSAPLFLFLIVATLIFSCSKKPDTIGLDLVDDNAPITGIDTTIEVVAYSRIEEPIYSDETSINMLGSMTTSTFGQTNASFYTHIRTLDLDTNLREWHDTIFVSAELTMVYSSAYGNLNTEQNIKVYRVAEDFHIDSSYKSNSGFKTEATLYADHTFFPDTTRKTIIDPENQSTSLQIATLKIPLNIQFAKDIFNLSNEVDSAWTSNDNFINTFKGLYIRSENISTTGEGSILYFDMLTDYSNIELKWENESNTDIDSLNFLINQNCARVGRYEHDYSLSSDPDFVLNTDSTIAGNNRLFLQCLAGVNTEITFPGIKTWADSGNIAINEAKLILTVDDYSSEYQPSSSLVMFNNIDSDDDAIADSYDFMRDQLQGDDYFGGQYHESSKTYTYRLTLHMQDLIAGEVDLGVALFPTAKAVKANEFKLFGTDPTMSRRLKMNIIYTKVE